MRGLVCAVLVVALTGCSPSEGEPERDRASSPPVPLAAPSNPGPSPQEEAVQAYRSMWGVVVEGSHEGAVGHPDLERYATGQALELTTAMLQGLTATGEPGLDPQAVIDPGDDSLVRVEDCLDDSGWTVQEPSGEEGVSGQRSVSATVVLQNEDWLVQDLWFEDYGTC